MLPVIGQIVGVLAMLFLIASFQMKERKGILALQMVAGTLFTAHYFMIGQYTGSVLNFIGVARCVVYYNKDKKWAASPVWLGAFIAVSITSGILTWENIFSLLPTVAMLFTSVSLWISNPKYVRLVSFPSSPLWLTYNVHAGSFAGVFVEIFCMISIIVAVIRFDIKKKGENGAE